MLSTLILGLLSVLSAVAPNGGVKWEADYGAALEQTREDDRPLLVVIDDSTDAAKRLDAKLLDPTGGAFPLESYDLCRVDVSTEYGKRVAEVFHATSFPHVAIIDKSGSVILTRVRGQVSEETWKATLAKYESGARGARTHTVSKPVVESASSAYTIPSEMYPAKPYCPSCQLNNR